MTISQHLADYVLAVSSNSLPEEAKKAARWSFLDGMACMILGADGDSVTTVMPYIAAHSSSEECIFPNRSKSKMDAIHCAMLGAISAHSNDFDDIGISLNGHPSALLVPVTTSIGQKLGLPGKAVLDAYIAGAEIDAILGKAALAMGYGKGWNATNFIGIFGAVAAIGKLMGLGRDKIAAALCIAVNEASGFKANFGSKAKDIAIGMTALKAISSAEYASYGVDACLDAFEGPFGFFQSMFGMCNAPAINALINEHKSDFIVPGIIMKPYPSCRGTHCGIDCTAKIIARNSFTLDDVRNVTCRMDQASYDADRYLRPQTPGQAKFSMAYCIARVISAGGITIEDFIGNEIHDSRSVEFASKVNIICEPESFPDSRFGAEVTIELNDGNVYSEKEYYGKGDPLNRMSDTEVLDKLAACLRSSLGEEKLEERVALLSSFDRAGDIREIFSGI